MGITEPAAVTLYVHAQSHNTSSCNSKNPSTTRLSAPADTWWPGHLTSSQQTCGGLSREGSVGLNRFLAVAASVFGLWHDRQGSRSNLSPDRSHEVPGMGWCMVDTVTHSRSEAHTEESRTPLRPEASSWDRAWGQGCWVPRQSFEFMQGVRWLGSDSAAKGPACMHMSSRPACLLPAQHVALHGPHPLPASMRPLCSCTHSPQCFVLSPQSPCHLSLGPQVCEAALPAPHGALHSSHLLGRCPILLLQSTCCGLCRT